MLVSNKIKIIMGVVCILERVAIIELNSDNFKLVLAEVVKNRSFVIFDEIEMPINLTKNLLTEEVIKPNTVKETVDVLKVYKEILDRYEITDVIAIATNIVKEAKNINGFLNEIFTTSGYRFRIVSAEEEINSIYTAVINTFNRPKGLIVNISNYSTQVLLYNRRNILNTFVMPYGSYNLTDMFYKDGVDGATASENVTKFVLDQIKDLDWAFNLEEEFDLIGAGNVFLNLGTISRRAKRYPIDVEHNYSMSKTDFEKVFDVIKPVKPVKGNKIKGISVNDSMYLPCGLAIVNAFMQKSNKDNFYISKTGLKEGLLFNYAIPLTIEKPISDNLGYSLQVINEYYDKKPNNAKQVYELSMILFRQLKVLHKLSRSYVRILRVASYLHDAGLRTSYTNKEKNSFNTIVNSDIYGVTHSELVLAGFVSALRNADNFNLSDWVRYKDLVTEDQLDAVKKLAVILKLAESLDVTGFARIMDISCDILGDSVIMKTITESNVDLEIKCAMMHGNEFKKAFNKNLEIL